jgi:hypothetical protein
LLSAAFVDPWRGGQQAFWYRVGVPIFMGFFRVTALVWNVKGSGRIDIPLRGVLRA